MYSPPARATRVSKDAFSLTPEPVLLRHLPIVSTRLKLRIFAACDEEALYSLHRDPIVTRFAGGTKTKNESRASLFRIIERTKSLGFGPLAVEHRANKAVIGWCGVQILPKTKSYEVIFALRAEHWGNGLATEAATAVMVAAFETLPEEIDSICGVVYPENMRSIRVLQKLGMLFRGTLLDSVSGRMAYRYSVTKTEFLENLTDKF